mgnify:CR=1 FL=1
MQSAANGSFEPTLTDAARCPNYSYAQILDFTKSKDKDRAKAEQAQTGRHQAFSKLDARWRVAKQNGTSQTLTFSKFATAQFELYDLIPACTRWAKYRRVPA